MAQTLTFSIVSDLTQAEVLWQQFSDNRTLFDTWEFRYCFYKYDNFPIHFIVGSDNGNAVGILPLQRNTNKGHLEFFGSDWMEEAKAYIKPEYIECMPQFFEQINEPAKLSAMLPFESFSNSLPVDDYNFRLPLNGFSSYWDFIEARFNPKGQQTWKRKIRKLEESKIEIVYNEWQDLDLLIANNLKTFGEDSSFTNPARVQIYHDFLNLNCCEKYLKTIVVDGVKQSVTLSLLYNGVFYYMNAGSNFEAVPNIGSFAILKDIDKAIEVHADVFNALMYSYNWKERWHLDAVPMHKFEKMLPEVATEPVPSGVVTEGESAE